MIQVAHNSGVQQLLFLGSSCNDPKLAVHPIVEEAMRRAYFERFNSSLSEKRDLVEKVTHDTIRLDEDKKPINNDDGTIEVDDIINADSEYSQWRDRDRMWMNRK